MKILLLTVIYVLLSGCTVTKKGDVFEMFGTFVDRRYAEPLEMAFGSTIPNRGIRFSVLSNIWSPVEPNTLSMNQEEVLYAEIVAGKLNKYRIAVNDCMALNQAVQSFYEQLPLLFEYASGNISYNDPAYLDGPGHVIEYWSEKANIYVAPISFSSNFPLVISANKVVNAVKNCEQAT